jgi:hypothetical protein
MDWSGAGVVFWDAGGRSGRGRGTCEGFAGGGSGRGLGNCDVFAGGWIWGLELRILGLCVLLGILWILYLGVGLCSAPDERPDFTHRQGLFPPVC